MKAKIESLLATKWAGRALSYVPEIDSTNIYAGRLGNEGAPHGTMVVSDKQTAGKGRRGRTWDSPAGENIYLSLLLRPEIAPDKASMLTLVMALAVAEGIREETGADPRIKWPNDIVLDGKKVCGILTEMHAEIGRIHHVVIGVGINVNGSHFPKEIQETATSLFLQIGKKQNRAVLIVRIMERFEALYEQFADNGDLSGLLGDYNRLLVNVNRLVRVLDPKTAYEGVALGVNEKGELLVRTDDGRVHEVYSGEVSVRGIYGYV